MRVAELALSFATAFVGALGGLGGAILLVPLLVLTGTTAREAAPLGLVSVAAGSLSASLLQVRQRSVNHRIGITTEVFASAAAVAGALASDLVSERAMIRILAAVAILAAFVGWRRKGIRNLPDDSLTESDVGEHSGSLSGVYQLGDRFVPYRAHNLAGGSVLFGAAGLLAGLAGASGGFIKTPATSEVMKVPVRVAAATTTFTSGITAATGLVVFALQDRLDLRSCAPVCVGAILGGRMGARFQERLSPVQVRRFLSALLVVVAVVLLLRS